MPKITVDKDGKMHGETWIGVDFDGTLAKRVPWNGIGHAQPGEPIPLMVKRIKQWLKEGKTVKILTARVCSITSEADRKEGERIVRAFCKKHLGRELEVTAEKDRYMSELWDDRAVQVVPDTGIAIETLIPKGKLK
jgi:hypothetical protein